MEVFDTAIRREVVNGKMIETWSDGDRREYDMVEVSKLYLQGGVSAVRGEYGFYYDEKKYAAYLEQARKELDNGKTKES